MVSPNENEVLKPILSELHLKWIKLNDKCKTLQSALTETTSKNEELEIKLTQSLERTAKIEEENKMLKMIVKKLQKKFLTGSVCDVISTLKQTIRIYDEAVLPSVLKLTKSITSTDSDFDISSKEDENNSSCLSALENHKSPAFSTAEGSSKSIETGVSHVNVSQSEQNALLKIIDIPSQVTSPKDVTKRLQEKAIFDTSRIEISSSSVTTSSMIVEKLPETLEISKTQSTKDQCFSSTTPVNIPTVNKADTELNVVAESSQNPAQQHYIDICDIESCVVEDEEQILESRTSSPVRTNSEVSINEAFLNSDSEFPPLEQKKQTQNNSNENDQIKGWKSKINAVKHSDISVTVLKSSNIEAIRCGTIEVETSESETNQSGRFKRLCPSPSNLNESSRKHSTSKKLKLFKKNRKCLICEYEDIDELNDKTFETESDLDKHIIENHPNPTPCYIRCMLNDGKCTSHFHAKQKFHEHVKQAHSHEDLDSFFETSQQQPLKCTTCGKLYLFENDLNEHRARAHDSVPNEKKTPSVCHKKSKFMAECEVCKKENRLFVEYRLYDELDSHIAKCHSDPFPDYLRCPYCTRHFKLVAWLTQHIINKHPYSYFKSPLEKFNLHQQQESIVLRCQEENEQEVMNDVDMKNNNALTPTSAQASLRILSPASINKLLSHAVKSVD